LLEHRTERDEYRAASYESSQHTTLLQDIGLGIDVVVVI
jgi:hypothetical protein